MNQSEPGVDHRDVLDHHLVGGESLLAEVVQHEDAAVALLSAWAV